MLIQILLTCIGAGGGLVGIIAWLRFARKDRAETRKIEAEAKKVEAEATDIVADSFEKLCKRMEEELDSKIKEVETLQNDLREMRINLTKIETESRTKEQIYKDVISKQAEEILKLRLEVERLQTPKED